MGKHEKKDPQKGDGRDHGQSEPKDSGRPGKHRKMSLDDSGADLDRAGGRGASLARLAITGSTVPRGSTSA